MFNQLFQYCSPLSHQPPVLVSKKGLHWNKLGQSCDISHQKVRTCCINDQCRSISINARSNFWHWHQSRSIIINVDQWKSIQINTSQYGEVLIDIDLYWSALIIIDPHFGSITEFWYGIDRYWSTLITETACPEKCRVISQLVQGWKYEICDRYSQLVTSLKKRYRI